MSDGMSTRREFLQAAGIVAAVASSDVRDARRTIW